ncbi:MAG: biotin/lipoyl-containing protein, partial [Bacillota bacterium]
MAEELIMPKLSMTMEEGQIVNWLVDEGDEVEEGEVILEVLSDKTNFEVEAPASGILLKKFYEADDVVPVTEVIGYIGEEGEDIEDLISDKEDKSEAEAEKEAVEEDKEEAAENKEAKKTPAAQKEQPAEKADKELKDEITTDKVKTVPAVRRIAEEKNIDLRKVEPTGENNVIEVKDIENYIAEMEKETEIKAYREKLSGIRRSSAKKVKESWTDIPHVTVTSEVNMEKIIELKDS